MNTIFHRWNRPWGNPVLCKLKAFVIFNPKKVLFCQQFAPIYLDLIKVEFIDSAIILAVILLGEKDDGALVFFCEVKRFDGKFETFL